MTLIGPRIGSSRKRLLSGYSKLGGVPDDIGGAVALLLAPENHWITWQRLEASGGMPL